MKLSPNTKFELLWASLGGGKLEREYTFAKGRKFRFDYFTNGVAIELEGGVFTRGRHTRPTGFLKDMEKYNLAASMGILVFRIPSHDITEKWLTPIIETTKRKDTK